MSRAPKEVVVMIKKKMTQIKQIIIIINYHNSQLLIVKELSSGSSYKTIKASLIMSLISGPVICMHAHIHSAGELTGTRW